MKTYVVNTTPDKDGHHEVHHIGCEFLPAPKNQFRLGQFSNCHPAVKEARKHFQPVNGCWHCSRECHTG